MLTEETAARPSAARTRAALALCPPPSI